MERVDICVRNPQTHFDSKNNKFMTYEIAVTAKSTCFALPFSTIRRQFLEFKWLRKQLRSDYPYINAPNLPPNLYFSDKYDPSCIAHRMKGLERFLEECIQIKNYRSDTTFHLFLQSDLPLPKLKEQNEGKCDPNFMELVWKQGGKTQPIAPDFWEQFENGAEGKLTP